MRYQPQLDRPSFTVRHHEPTRRMALGRLGTAVAVGLGLLSRGSTAVADHGTPGATTEMRPPFLDAWLAVWTSDDGRPDALYSDDAVLEDMGEGQTYEGRDAAAGHAAAILAAFPDQAREVRAAFISGDWAAVELLFTGSYSGSYPGLPAGAGQHVAVPVVAIFELEGDRIRRESHYYDSYLLLNQIGLVPEFSEFIGTPAP